MLNSSFLLVKSHHILRITFCLSPSPSLWGLPFWNFFLVHREARMAIPAAMVASPHPDMATPTRWCTPESLSCFPCHPTVLLRAVCLL